MSRMTLFLPSGKTVHSGCGQLARRESLFRVIWPSGAGRFRIPRLIEEGATVPHALGSVSKSAPRAKEV
jgi:hypothetical protein